MYKKHNNYIDAGAWVNSLCYHYKLFTFNSNNIRLPKHSGLWTDIFGNKVLTTYYELTVSLGDDSLDNFNLGIADSNYKNKDYLSSK